MKALSGLSWWPWCLGDEIQLYETINRMDAEK
jgi:hypothetical protein